MWLRIQTYKIKSPQKLVLRPRQERLLQFLQDRGRIAPGEIWSALAISKQGAMDLLRPLLKARVVEKIGGKKTGRYALRRI